RSSTESSAASRLGYKDTTFALTLRLPGSDSGRSSSLAAPSDAAPSPKARVVGWPPVRSYRKNALADSSKASRAANFVKVVVDGAAYLRKSTFRSRPWHDPKPAAVGGGGWLSEWGWDLMLGSIAAFYAVMAPYTKVEESFNVQAMHDILYHTYHIEM
ncbi:hypothetical protein ACJX0J_041027, partial [Zea mays]